MHSHFTLSVSLPHIIVSLISCQSLLILILLLSCYHPNFLYLLAQAQILDYVTLHAH